MAFTYNNSKIERVIYNGKIINVTKFNDEIILEDNVIKVGSFTGNSTLTTLNEEITINIEFTSNNITFNKIKINSNYVYYINDTDESPVYSFSNNSWAAAYKTLSILNKTFVENKFYEWFSINYIKG